MKTFRGYFVFENAVPVRHRIWFKIWFNPILRKLFGYHIVSEVVMDPANYHVKGYHLWPYKGTMGNCTADKPA